MTPEDRALELKRHFLVRRAELGKGSIAEVVLIADIAAAIRAAVVAEREACARLADGWAPVGWHAERIAAAIRARGG